jgi:hypothetical protein
MSAHNYFPKHRHLKFPELCKTMNDEFKVSSEPFHILAGFWPTAIRHLL